MARTKAKRTEPTAHLGALASIQADQGPVPASPAVEKRAKVPQSVLDLVALFSENFEDYEKPTFNETQLRRQFIDPLFEALGWDVSNRNGYAEQYKEVVHEDTLQDEGRRKAPDYSFRIGRERKFYVEAKKPAVDIDKDKSPAYQLRRYAWSSKLPISVLTNFDALSVYDTRCKPEKDDAAKVGRVKHFRYSELPERWPELWDLLSKDAVLRGAFDRYASSKALKKGTAAVDEDFLNTIERWRADLATVVYSKNKSLDAAELSFVVQSLIDRILFLRICEDKSIERYGSLLEVTKKSQSYRALLQKFGDAQKRYNSGLFHVVKEGAADSSYDALSAGITVPDKALNAIIEDLYFPKSPYEFSVISPEILGSVYERFLGSTITIDRGQAVVDLKPEQKKAGGVFYTPDHRRAHDSISSRRFP